MAAPIRQSVCQILKTKFLKSPCHFDKSLHRNISFFNTSFKRSSFKFFTTKYAKVLAGIVGVSSVFATKAVWNGVSAESPAVDNAPSLNVSCIFKCLISFKCLTAMLPCNGGLGASYLATCMSQGVSYVYHSLVLPCVCVFQFS